MNRAELTATEALAAPRPGRGLFGRIVLHGLALALAGIAFVAHEHFKLAGNSSASLATLIAAALLALAPLRAVLGEVFSLPGKALHAFHGLGGLALVGLVGTGAISGAPLLSHAAMAPFAIMGAAQALMHSEHPRNAEQAVALRRFVTSLPEAAQVSRADLTSPASAARAVTALQDLITKAQALGETELKADPAFQSAWAQTTTRAGLTLGLDSIDHAISRLAQSPAAGGSIPELRRRLAQARALAQRTPPAKSANSGLSP
ncbi:MAG TPA: hypothetical protein VLX90_13030 [Steroidobacteraceae bacterium]|nr:hypothetical protein [Steroidobacteraceae bacterium]